MAAVALAAPSVRADGLELRVRAPAACADEAKLRAGIDAALGEPADARAPFSGDVTIVPVDGGFRLTVVVRSAVGDRDRELTDPSCEHLADAAAVILALAIQEARKAAPVAPAAAEPTPPAPPHGPALPFMDARVPPRDAAETPERGRVPVRVLAAGAGVVAVGALPAPAPGFTAGVALERGALRVEVALVVLASERGLVGLGPAGGDVGLTAGAVRGCWLAVRARRLSAGPCLGLEAGAMQAHGFGVDHPGSGAEPWVAPSLGLRASLPLGDRVAFAAVADAIAPLDRPRFLLPQIGDVYRPPPVAGRFGGGVEFRLW